MRRDQQPPRLSQQAMWNATAFMCTLAAQLVIVPIAVSRIGVPAFGTAAVVVAAYAPFVLIGTVLSQFVIRETSVAIASGAFENAIASLKFSLVACGVLGTVLLCALLLFSPWIAAMLNLAGSLAGARLAFLLAGAGWFAQQFLLIAQAVIVGARRFRALAALSAVTAISNVLIVLQVLDARPTIQGFLLGQALAFAFALMLCAVLVRVAMRHLFVPRIAPARSARDGLGFVGWLAGTNLLSGFALQMDRYALSALATPLAVGSYAVATRLQEVVHMGLLKLGEVLLPHFGAGVARPMAERQSDFLRSSLVLTAISSAALAPLIPLSDRMIFLWIGAESTELATIFLRTLATAGILGAAANPLTYQLLAQGQSRRLMRISVAYALVAIPCTLIAIAVLGPAWAGTGLVVASAIRFIIVIRVGESVFAGDADGGTRVVRQMGILLPPVVAGLASGWLVAGMGLPGAGSGWLSVVLLYATLFVLTLLASTTLAALFPEGRRTLTELRAALPRSITSKAGS